MEKRTYEELEAENSLLLKEIMKLKDIEVKREKKINFYIRAVLRLMAWAVLTFYMIYKIIMPVTSKEPLYLDTNDGYIMIGCIGLLLAIEAVKTATEKWLSKKTT
ncbi:MAG TPA: hypothetical protein VFM69_01145 [Pricia sp.]|nr:hypothetical protein [Pricia sp.]